MSLAAPGEFESRGGKEPAEPQRPTLDSGELNSAGATLQHATAQHPPEHGAALTHGKTAHPDSLPRAAFCINLDIAEVVLHILSQRRQPKISAVLGLLLLQEDDHCCMDERWMNSWSQTASSFILENISSRRSAGCGSTEVVAALGSGIGRIVSCSVEWHGIGTSEAQGMGAISPPTISRLLPSGATAVQWSFREIGRCPRMPPIGLSTAGLVHVPVSNSYIRGQAWKVAPHSDWKYIFGSITRRDFGGLTRSMLSDAPGGSKERDPHSSQAPSAMMPSLKNVSKKPTVRNQAGGMAW
eukprot:CAMPEP_0117666946 /NCGR_PEP_ID=MMETSP0804-20121206/10669_1 /TAXON_ID=1074897 /ORGANISM="Tetraselmis astigmatica, Strain CCMP880" /LENGTH=297 /DNA_ID=CAMNT_0005474569 /DNA_START=775 /DNA_END=1667 /DNA_ORIENTATION=-